MSLESPVYKFRQDTWDYDKCEKLSKSCKKDYWNIKYPQGLLL